jgi:hypothetical protein
MGEMTREELSAMTDQELLVPDRLPWLLQRRPRPRGHPG